MYIFKYFGYYIQLINMALSKNMTIAIAAVVVVIIVAAAAAVVLSDNGGNPSDEGPSGYEDGSVTVTTFTDYNGNTATLTFDSVPDRVVVGCNTALNLLLYLGLGDNIVGIYYNEEEVWDEVADEYAEVVERLGEVDASGARNLSQNISTDVLLSWEPDLVIGWVSWNDEGLGSVDFFKDNGCNVMSFNSMTDSSYRNLESMKTDYDNIGKIFNVSDKTTALYNQIIDTVDSITTDLEGQDTIYYALVDGAVDVDEGTIWVYSDTNFIASVLNQIGLTNAFPAGGTISLASVYEAIGTTNIDLLIFIAYDNVNLEGSVASWLADPDLSQCEAVQNGDYIEMKLSCSYGTSPELLDVLEYVENYVLEMNA